MGDALSEIFDEPDFRCGNLPENLFSMMETLEDLNGDVLSFSMFEDPVFSSNGTEDRGARMAFRDATCLNVRRRCETDEEDDEQAGGERKKKLKRAPHERASEEGREDQPKMSHITVERNRRKQMNEHLVVLRSLMPSFYVKRGDQASIIGGVVEYIKELQQLLTSLEAKKQRKVYSEVLSPRQPLSSPLPLSSPRSLPPRPPASPCRPSPLCSPRTPQPASPYKPWVQSSYGVLSPSMASSHESSSSLETSSGTDRCLLAADYRNSQAANVEVKLSGPNVVLKTVSHCIPGQALKIIGVLERLALEILRLSISSTENTMLFSFTIKIGIECALSAEELAQEVRRTFV